MRLDDYRPVEESGKESDSLFKSKIMQKSNRYFDYIITITGKYTIFVIAIRKESKTYCSMVSQSPREKRRAIQLKLGLPRYGRRLPISVVVCGEPRDLWRMSAPFMMCIMAYNLRLRELVLQDLV